MARTTIMKLLLLHVTSSSMLRVNQAHSTCRPCESPLGRGSADPTVGPSNILYCYRRIGAVTKKAQQTQSRALRPWRFKGAVCRTVAAAVGMLPPTSDTSLPPASDAWPAGQRFVQAPPQLTGGAALPKVALPNALGSGDHTPMSEAETMQWNSQDWKWDPYAVRAMAAPHDAKTLGNNKQASTAGVEPPTSSSVQASQPAKLPSLAMSSGSRSKSHPTCQVRILLRCSWSSVQLPAAAAITLSLQQGVLRRSPFPVP